MSASDPPTPDIPKPDVPKPDVPKPDVPKPNIPKPNIPAPNLDRASSASPVSAVETGAMETPAPKPAASFDEDISTVEYSETLLPQRIVAGIIDYVVAGTLIWVADFILPNFLGVIPTAFGLVYLLFKDSLPFLGGQSVGKKAMKIQAVTTDDTPLTNDFTKGITRNIFTAIPPLALVEVLILHNREKAFNAGLRLGDDFAKTKIISLAPETTEAPESEESAE